MSVPHLQSSRERKRFARSGAHISHQKIRKNRENDGRKRALKRVQKATISGSARMFCGACLVIWRGILASATAQTGQAVPRSTRDRFGIKIGDRVLADISLNEPKRIFRIRPRHGKMRVKMGSKMVKNGNIFLFTNILQRKIAHVPLQIKRRAFWPGMGDIRGYRRSVSDQIGRSTLSRHHASRSEIKKIGKSRSKTRTVREDAKITRKTTRKYSLLCNIS